MPRTRPRSRRLATLPAAAAALLLTAVPHAVAQPGPTLTVPQASSVAAGKPLTVTGEGFTPDTLLFVTICDPKQPPGRACDMGDFAQATTDGSGKLTATLTANATFGTTDCTTTACAVMTNDPAHPRETRNFAQAPIVFAGSSPTAAGPSPSASPSNSPAQRQNTDESGTNAGAIVVGVAVAASALAIAFVLVLLVRRRSA